MDDDHLNHLCMLASIKIAAMRDIDRQEWCEEMVGASFHDLKTEWTTISVLAKCCAELMARQGIKPKFKVKSTAEP